MALRSPGIAKAMEFPKPPGMNPMQGFGPGDIPTNPQEFVDAAAVLEWAASHHNEWCDGSDFPEIAPDVAKRVSNVLKTMAAAFASQATAAADYERAKREGRLKAGMPGVEI